jgi:hypothetical protein
MDGWVVGKGSNTAGWRRRVPQKKLAVPEISPCHKSGR